MRHGMRYVQRVVLATLLAGAAAVVGVTGCSGSGQERAGPGVIFNNVIAADMGGELKVVFPDYSRAPATEQARKEDENFLITIRPAWSPDGEKLAFMRTMRGEREVLFIRTSLGHVEAEPTEIGLAAGMPVWSPTSDMVAYLQMSDSGEAEHGNRGVDGVAFASSSEGGGQEAVEKPVGLTVVGDRGENKRVIVAGEAEAAAWSEDGIYFTSGIYGARDLRVVDPDTKKAKRVYAAAGDNFVGEAALSADGEHMAIEVVGPSENSVLVIKDLGSGRVVQATRRGRISDVEWSPDSKRIAFVLEGTAGGGRYVMVCNATGGGVKAVTATTGRYRSPTWSPNSGTVAYVDGGDIYMQEIGAKKARQLTKTADAAEIICSPK